MLVQWHESCLQTPSHAQFHRTVKGQNYFSENRHRPLTAAIGMLTCSMPSGNGSRTKTLKENQMSDTRTRRITHSLRNATTLVMTVAGNGFEMVFDYLTLSNDMKQAAGVHGLKQVLSDSASGEKDPDAIAEKIISRFEVISGGEWSDRATGVGPRPSLIAMAVRAALINAGHEVDDEALAGIRAKLATKEQRDGAMANPKFAVEYERLRVEAAQQRLNERETKAVEAPDDFGDFAAV